MPIYAYKCSSCGHEKDVLQKVSSAPLTICPQCQAEAFTKQLTAAGFQLKGSGWYATDFKNGSGSPKEKTEKGTSEQPKAAETDTAGTKTVEKKETPAASAGGACGNGGCSACN